jgi:hypothetical protein
MSTPYPDAKKDESADPAKQHGTLNFSDLSNSIPPTTSADTTQVSPTPTTHPAAPKSAVSQPPHPKYQSLEIPTAMLTAPNWLKSVHRLKILSR